MTARVLSLDAWRYGRQIVERAPVAPTAAEIERARMIEQCGDVELIDRWASAQSVLHPSYDKIGEAES